MAPHARLSDRPRLLAVDGCLQEFDSRLQRPAGLFAIAAAHGDRAIWLTPEQKQAYAGNAITLSGDRVWMSARAAGALTDAQRAQLESWGFRIGAVALDEIEKAGGSLRCCVAEIF